MEEKNVKQLKRRMVTHLVLSLLAGSLAVVMLVTCLTGTLAWFARNSKTDNSGMGLRSDVTDFNVSFSYYKNDIANETYAVSSNLSSIEFNQYDLVFRSINRHTPIVVRMAMQGADLASSGTITATITRNTAIPATRVVGNHIEMNDFCSSVMRFTPYIGASYYSSNAETQYKNIDTDGHFNAVRALTGSSASSKVFTAVTLTNNAIAQAGDVVKQDQIALSYTYTAEDFVDGVLYAYIYITYDEGYDNGTYSGLTGIYQRTSGITAIGELSATFGNDFLDISVTHS